MTKRERVLFVIAAALLALWLVTEVDRHRRPAPMPTLDELREDWRTNRQTSSVPGEAGP